jgi:hypothetical protein
LLCIPGQSIACVGSGGCAGGQACNADGTAYLACDCGLGPDAGPSPSPDDAGSSPVDAGPSGSADSSSGPSFDSGGGPPSSDSGAANLWDSGSDGSSTGSEAGLEGGVDSGLVEGGDDASSDDGSIGVVTTATFEMVQTCPDITNAATLVISLEGTAVSVQRTPAPGGSDQDVCSYAGTLNADCDEIDGTYSCTSGGGTWSATFTGDLSGVVCTLATTWAEYEMFPGTTGCDATWTQEGGEPLSN